ncbi:hypothetical protein ACMFMG_000115 [Clarireedia jacksonii]
MDPLPPFPTSPVSSTNDIFSFEELLSDEDINSWVDLSCWSDFTDSSISATTAGGLHSAGSPPSWLAFVGGEGEGNYHSASSPNTASSLGSLPCLSVGRTQETASMTSPYQLVPQSSSMGWESHWGQTLISASTSTSYDTPSSALYTQTPVSATTAPSTYPTVPNQPLSLITPLIDPVPFASTVATSQHKFHSHPLVYKSGATPHELRMHLAAGNSAITLHGTVSRDIPASSSYSYTTPTSPLTGLLLSLETPLKPHTYTPTYRKKTTEAMKTAVLSLHARGIIHGDIHLSNFLYCATDSSVRLTGFQDAFFETEAESSSEEEWTPITSGTIISPNRARLWLEGVDRRANREDDLFALGICVWEVWTGRRYVDGGRGGGGGVGGFEKKGGWEALRRGKCVNVGLVGDKATRAMLRGWLRAGGGVV